MTKMQKGMAVIIISILICVSSVSSLDLSTVVYNSEDELIEALALGEISYYEFLRARELIIRGIDNDSKYLLDAIPNLTYFKDSGLAISDPVEEEQKQPYLRNYKNKVKGYVDYKYYQSLDESENSSYRNFINLNYAKKFRFRFRIHRTNQWERIKERSLTYKVNSGIIKEIIAGNFTERWGLGTVIGYNGTIARDKSGLNMQSLAYPDYSGFNGLKAEFGDGSFRSGILFSQSRDDSVSFQTTAGNIFVHHNDFESGIIIGNHRVENRNNNSYATVQAFAWDNHYKYSNGYGEIELTGQKYKDITFVSFVCEGRHRFEKAEIKWAGWNYHDNFIDLTTGSKAAALLSEIWGLGFGVEKRSQRPGQSGAMVRTVVGLSEDARFSNSLLLAGRENGDGHLQFYSSLIRDMSDRLELQIDYLSRSKRGSKSVSSDTDHRLRLMTRYKNTDLSVRSYIAYKIENQSTDIISLFVNVSYSLSNRNNFQFWSRMTSSEQKTLSRWYLFVRGEQQLFESLTVAIKLANTYSQNDATDPNNARVSLELKAWL